MIITQQEKDENDPIYIFFQKNTFNSVRIALIKIVNAIRGNIKNPIYPSEEKTVAIITNILPSTCFVKFNDKSEQLPNKLLPKIKGKQKNDSIILSIVNGKIIDVLS
jgi:hypothetical protein